MTFNPEHHTIIRLKQDLVVGEEMNLQAQHLPKLYKSLVGLNHVVTSGGKKRPNDRPSHHPHPPNTANHSPQPTSILMDAYGSSKLHIINDTYSPLEKSPAICFLFPLSPQTVYLSGN